MRAGCSASTFILVAAWEQSLHPGSPGHSLANREGPVKAEIAIRTTGLSDRGTQPGGQDGPHLPTVDDRRQQRSFRRVIIPRPLDCGLGPLPRADLFCLGNVHQTPPGARPGLSMPRRSRSLGDRAVARMAPTASPICPISASPGNAGSLSRNQQPGL